jgi:ectoine hydroxylase-related dioxygenase (phytanoyl-CoA dioxygenase family)
VRIDVTPEQVEQFRDRGFVVLEGFLDRGELETWRAVVGDAVDQRLAERNGLTNLGSDDFYRQVFTQCLRLADTHAGIAELVRDPRLGELAATLTGVEGIRIWHDQALIKQPYGNQTAWHLDDPYWAFYTRNSVNMWFALDDATLANGCLWYLPGTHLEASYELVKIGRNMADLFKLYPHWKEIEAVPAPCPAGSVVVHNGMVAHAAGPNMTPRPRRAMTSVYFPDGERYNGRPDTLPEEYYSTLRAGDVLDDDRYLPLVWSRKTPTKAV